MKINYKNPILFLGAAYLLTACTVKLPSEKTPKSSYYGVIDKITMNDGYPANQEAWIVISDRHNNTVFMDKGSEKSQKEIKFLEPLLVVKSKPSKGLVKVAEYNADALMKKLPSNSIKTYGWIPANQLLLWTNAVKNSQSGFSIKAAVVPNSSDVLKNSEKYLKNDSVLVFTSPDLSKTTKTKLPVGQLVYIYKHAENAKRYLIGKTPTIKIDSIDKSVYGWVSSNMVAAWGDRTALRVSPDYQYTEENNLAINKTGAADSTAHSYFRLSDSYHRTPVENLIAVSPAELDKENKARFFSNALDYRKNFVYNVAGNSLYFERYKDIINKSKNLNIVFVMDISNENSQNTAMAKSSFQDIQLKLKNIEYYKSMNFGAVLYKNNTCGENVAVSPFTRDFEMVSKFIEERLKYEQCNSYGGQPMQEGLSVAGDLLAPFSDETNIVVLVGSTAGNGYINSAVSSLSAARAKIISYQTISGASDTYNNFVLLSENLVTNTAKNIAELEKERSANQSIVRNRNNYNLQEGEEGIFSLDYPKTSMSQGFVIFPKKGEMNSSALLAKALDSLISQVTYQNRESERTLTSYFKSVVGASKTEFRPDFRGQFPDAPAKIPVETASQLITYENPFLTDGTYDNNFKDYFPAVQKGILLSEEEYDKLRKLYLEIYQQTKPFSPDFSQSNAVNAYLEVLKKNNISTDGFSKSNFRRRSMAYSVAHSTGFDNANEEMLSRYELRGWKRSKVLSQEDVRSYFKQYMVLANRLLDNKNSPKVMIEQNGEIFYWLNEYFMPMINPKESL
ncbi:Uncharacterised protein [Chryseobacterium taklimakanense]|uniref:VWA domain-containing protein n=1 Tax=Chryseobacterium taklimakanense TaxID=536441 RepID=A0A239WJT0_9FLAO|nr:type VI secretion system protein TssR domain-containing protein [Chryseobacterium taklimakanense]SNV34717.1 Uncharacterised protein [Chryseobacterium taklimakanense]